MLKFVVGSSANSKNALTVTLLCYDPVLSFYILELEETVTSLKKEFCTYFLICEEYKIIYGLIYI